MTSSFWALVAYLCLGVLLSEGVCRHSRQKSGRWPPGPTPMIIALFWLPLLIASILAIISGRRP